MAEDIFKNAREIVSKSGNNFHYGVVNNFRQLGWTVSVSPFYNDNYTDKPREIDIIAEKAFDVHSVTGSSWIGTLNVQLYIECKYINAPTVFWVDAVNKNELLQKLMRDTGLESPELNTTIETHRFMSLEKVAKLFSTKTDKQEGEVMYKALNQSLNAMISFKGSSSIIASEKRKVTKVLHTLKYPVIVCSSFDNFFQVDVTDENEMNKIRDNFAMEVNYSYRTSDGRNLSEYFLIDVVEAKQLDKYLNKLVETDIQTVSKKLTWDNRA